MSLETNKAEFDEYVRRHGIHPMEMKMDPPQSRWTTATAKQNKEKQDTFIHNLGMKLGSYMNRRVVE